MTSKSIEIDDYINSQKLDIADKFRQIRDLVHKIIPQVEECITYGMPAFRYHGYLLGFFGYNKHYSIFPMNGHFVSENSELLKWYKTTKASIHFDYDKPLPIDLVHQIITIRMQENLANKK